VTPAYLCPKARQSPELERHHHPQQGRGSRLGRSARSREGRGGRRPAVRPWPRPAQPAS